MFNKEKEEIKRLKLKLQLYGSYQKEVEMLEHKYLEIQEELKMNDMPSNAAKNLGYYSSDPKNPAVDKMKIDQASILDEMGQAETEISYLGLDDFFNKITPLERQVIDEKYVRDNTLRNIAVLIDSNKSTVHRMIDNLIEKRDASQ